MADSVLGLTDKVALVTGSGMGIGRGCALMLAKAGANVAVVDMDEASARRTAKEVQDLGRKAVSISATLRQDSEIVRMLA